jgi:DNA polymerase-4
MHGGQAVDRPLTALFIDCDSFFASVEEHLDPRIRGKPVGVAPVMHLLKVARPFAGMAALSEEFRKTLPGVRSRTFRFDRMDSMG